MSFSAAVAKYGVTALDKVDKIRRASILDLIGLIIEATPVDTGLLRGNFQASINAPVTSKTDREDKTGDAVIAEAMANLGSLADIFFLTNNLPYAERIEYEGFSAQAPEGMVRISAARWAEIV
jgi:predicted short-subunit dehydrogenase-like oxidoreductase (DUF2520 family)